MINRLSYARDQCCTRTGIHNALMSKPHKKFTVFTRLVLFWNRFCSACSAVVSASQCYKALYQLIKFIRHACQLYIFFSISTLVNVNCSLCSNVYSYDDLNFVVTAWGIGMFLWDYWPQYAVYKYIEKCLNLEFREWLI